VVGFALSAYPIAVERGWMTRADAVQRSLATLRFFRDSDQSGSPEATGYKGFYYHFLDMQTGIRMWRSELSMIDTAMLIAGALTAASYFNAETKEEIELRGIVDALYRRIDWSWTLDGKATIRLGWKPECGFLNYGWDGYNEAIVLYVLALGSPTHPIAGDSFEAWTGTYQWENLYGYDFLYAGPLFIHQFSHAWIDFRGIQDRFMREKRCDYFENSRRATEVQREYARRNPHGFAGYDENCWGVTACDGPSQQLSNFRKLNRVPNYVEQNLTQSRWVGFDPCRNRCLVVQSNIHPFSDCARSHQRYRFFYDLRWRNMDFLDRHLTRFDLRHIEDVVDNCQQVICIGLDRMNCMGGLHGVF